MSIKKDSVLKALISLSAGSWFMQNTNKAFHASAARHAYPGRLLYVQDRRNA
jgi:hypothetical protein